MSNIDQTTQMLILVLVCAFVILLVLCFVYFMLKRKDRKIEEKNNPKINKEQSKESTTTGSTAGRKSIFDFMDFDKIEDNMVIQHNGKRFVMAIECAGINYDLMSEVEKTAVEQGFIEFLNTLRHPIQLYIQTRTINISSSIENYNHKLEETRQELVSKQNEYTRLLQSNSGNTKILNELKMEIARIQNLYDYGKDIISNTEKMSLNKNVLRKHYYIILSYYASELGTNITDEEEKRNMIFAELYTRAQTIIRTLFACSMKGKVLDSNELAELLYVAYNRDESETFGIDKAMRAGYDDLYSTAPDVFEKKIKALDQVVHDRAVDLANQTVDKVKSKAQQKAEQKEGNLEDLIKQMAEIIIGDNRNYIGPDVAVEAINELENSKEEGEDNSDEKVKKETRGRKKKTTNA